MKHDRDEAAQNALEVVIRDFLHSEVGRRDEPIDRDTPLLTSGLVDSAGLLRLAAVLEQATARLIPDRDLTVEHFNSITRILAYVEAFGKG